MAAITDPVALKFVDEVLRPLAELVRDINHKISNAEMAWFNGVNAVLTGSNTVENRVDDGCPILTGTECTNMVAALMAVRDASTESGGREALIQKFTVTPLD